MKVNLNGKEFILSDDKPEIGDFFVEIKNDGEIEPYILHMIKDDEYDQYDYVWKGIDIIVMKHRDFIYNSNSNYKKIIL